MPKQSNTPDLQPQRLYTKAAAARLMGVGLDTVKRLLNEGKLEQAERRGPNKWATITGASIMRFTRTEKEQTLIIDELPTKEQLRELRRQHVARLREGGGN